MWFDARAAATLDDECVGVRTDDCERAYVKSQRQRVIVVLQQHEALACGAASNCAVDRVVDAFLFVFQRVNEAVRAFEQRKHAPNLVVDHRLFHFAGPHRIGQLVGEVRRWPGHFEIETGVGSGNR